LYDKQKTLRRIIRKNKRTIWQEEGGREGGGGGDAPEALLPELLQKTAWVGGEGDPFLVWREPFTSVFIY
jgi:hypothetical protein